MAKRIKMKFKGIKKNKYIKDKSLIHFIYQHSLKAKIDFTKIKIPSISNFSEIEEDDFKEIKSKCLKMPDFRFSLLNIFFTDDDNSQKITKFESFIFK